MSTAHISQNDLSLLADAIARAAPFSAWPHPAVSRLARSSKVTRHRARTILAVAGRRVEAMIVVIEGAVIASVTSPGGRRVTFKVDATYRAYGLLPLVDGQAMPSDLVADEPVTVIRIPHAAIRDELARMPSLWQSIAIDAADRARRYTEQMKQFLFDAPRVRAASILLGLAAQGEEDLDTRPVVIAHRLPQDRLAEMLGISRQWAAVLVRELTATGLVQWRYGRVTVLNPSALRALAAKGINATDLTAPPAPPPVRASSSRVPRPPPG